MLYICTPVQQYRQIKGFMIKTLELSLWGMWGSEGWEREKECIN